MAGENKTPDLQIEEDPTGGAVVALPDDFEEHDDTLLAASDGARVQTAAGATDDEPAPSEAADPADDDHPDDTEAVRQAKRDRRRAKKQLARNTSRQRDAELAQLRRENQQLRQEVGQRLSAVEQRAVQQDLSRFDQELSDADVRVEYARMQLQQATEAQNAAAMVEAQEALADAKAAKQQLAQRAQQFRQQVEQRPRAPVAAGPDPSVQRYAQSWAKRNNWFDPNANTRDPDSRVARTIDQTLSQEGYDPTTQEYWDELDDRLRKYLPHRYTAPASGGNPTPRNTVGSSGREGASGAAGNGRATFTLSPERVAAMKAAGAWDNPERRARMIKQYMTYDRAHRS
jgi:hypothetical protein